MTIEINRFESARALGGEAGLMLRQAIGTLPADKEFITIGLCGGRSVGTVLFELAAQLRQLPSHVRDKLHFFLVDERLVPLDDPESNFRALRGMFFDPVVSHEWLRRDQIHPFQSTPDSAAADIIDYGHTLGQYGGQLDIVLLSAGEDGHIASLFPNHRSLFDGSAPFVLVENSPKPPARRMTASVGLLNSAQFAFLLFVGEGKRDALRRFVDPSLNMGEVPAKIVQEVAVLEVFSDLQAETERSEQP